jgi:hypothetical protein
VTLFIIQSYSVHTYSPTDDRLTLLKDLPPPVVLLRRFRKKKKYSTDTPTHVGRRCALHTAHTLVPGTRLVDRCLFQPRKVAKVLEVTARGQPIPIVLVDM